MTTEGYCGTHAASPGHQLVREALTLAEAGYLADSLRARGIECEVLNFDSNGTDGAFNVQVSIQDSRRAARVADTLLPGTTGRPEAAQPVSSTWTKGLCAGGLGLLAGLRVGAGLRQPALGLAFGFVLGSFALAATMHFSRRGDSIRDR